MALRATSFERAAADYGAATGGSLPRMSVWRVTQGAGAILAQRKKVEAERAVAVPERGESPRQRRVAVDQPIAGRANISSDGTMILIRDERWKEIKISAISAVSVRETRATPASLAAPTSDVPQVTTGAESILPERGTGDAARVVEGQASTGHVVCPASGAMTVQGEGGQNQITASAVSALRGCESPATLTDVRWRDGQRVHESRVRLSEHSYVAGLSEADEFLPYQYAEGLRRGLDRVSMLSSVNDAAAWIERLTATNFPHAVQIVDWSHGCEHLHAVAHEVFGEGSRAAGEWVEAQKNDLWAGGVDQVIQSLDDLGLEDMHWSAGVRQAPGYFAANASRMCYPDFRDAGFPIGSGTVESAANTVVQLRMRRPGRGWARAYVNGMIALLCEYHSDRFDRTWASLSQPAA